MKKEQPKLSAKVNKGYKKEKCKCKHADSEESKSPAKAKKAKSKKDVKSVSDKSKESKGDQQLVNLDEMRTISSSKSVTIPADAFQSVVDFVRFVKYM